ncbi:MAG: c-type cytochrome biogenesis protein CcmI [Rhodomicrobium sp.]
MIWLLFSALTALVVAAVIAPVALSKSAYSSAVPEAEVYKLQLADLDREEERGTIEKEEAEIARAEISRRLLRAGRQKSPALKVRNGAMSNAAFAPVAASIAIGAFGLYFYLGEPSLADQPLDGRLSVPTEQQTLSIQIAVLERKVRENASDADAWAQLAPAYFSQGNFDKSSEAFRKTIELSGENEERLVGLAEALIFANNGQIPEDAKQALKTAVLRNPKSTHGRLWLGIVAEQEGRKADAQKAYADLLNEDLNGTLRRIVTDRLTNLSGALAQNAAPHGQGSGDAPKGHEGGIRDMVDRLAERLKENKGSLDSWLMLMRSYYVLKEPEKAQDAVARARQQFASDPKALEAIDALVREATSPDAKAAEQAPASSSEEKGVQQVTPNSPDAALDPMILGMVSRLAERLKDNKGDLEGWLKLIRSYAVLKEPQKAQDAAVSARQQFAGDAKALEQIDTLLQEVKVTLPDKKEGAPK